MSLYIYWSELNSNFLPDRFPYDTWAEFTHKVYPYLLAGLVVEVLANSSIAIAVSYELLHGRSGIRQYVRIHCFNSPWTLTNW
jgi:hypothetical protein